MNSVITLPVRFTFDAHREFRQAYWGQPVRPEYVVDFGQTEFVDSAALGMLLQLREYAGQRRDVVRLRRVRPEVRSLLDAAGFPELFHIEQ